MPITLRAAIYARVSSAAQRHDQTIRTQLEQLRSLAALRGYTVVEEYVDDGHTARAGHLEARLGLARLFADAKAKRFDVVLVVDVDRLTRAADSGERGEVLAVFQRARIPVVTPGATYDLSSSTGDLLAMIAAWKAADDNLLRGLRTIEGQSAAARRGHKPRGPTPIGLRYDRASHSWAIDPERAEVVRELFERVAAGEVCGQIANDLDARGITRPRAGRWTQDRIRRLVQSDVYLGRFLVDRGRDLSVPVPPIVPPELALAARGVLLARFRHPPPRTKKHHLLGGLARCGLCHALIGMSQTTERSRANPLVTAYRCANRRRPPAGQPPCTLPILQAEATDAAVWAVIVEALSTASVFDRALSRERATEGDQPDPAKLEAELRRLDKLQDGVLVHAARGDIDQAVADRQVARLAVQRRAAQAALSAATAAARGIRPATSGREVVALLAGFVRNAHRATPEQRSRLVRAATATAVIRPEMIALDLIVDVASLSLSVGQGDSPGRRARPRSG